MSDEEEPTAQGLSPLRQPLPEVAEPFSATIGITVPPRSESVRHALSIDVHWPDGASKAGSCGRRPRKVGRTDGAEGEMGKV